MEFGKVKPTATVVAQFPAGLEVEAIMHEGKVFMPVMSMGDFGTSGAGPTAPAPTKTPKKSAPAPEPEEAEEETSASYTEEELMDMSAKEITKILKDEFGIDPADYPGKNTNKKLRDLVLNALEEGDEEEAEEEEETPAPAKAKSKKVAKEESEEEDEDEEEGGESEGLLDEVSKLLEDFDSGALNKKRTISKLVALGKDADEDAVAGIIDNFESDDKIEIDDVAEQLVGVIETTPKKAAKKTSKKAAPKKSKKEDLVTVDELEEGERVSVYWEGEDFDEWYDGEVKSIKKSRKGVVVTIAYDDDTEDAIDPEIHTKIKRLD